MNRALTLFALSLALGSCGSPPKPPAADLSQRRPANAALAVEAQVCRSELQNARIAARESDQKAAALREAAARSAARAHAIPASVVPPRNTVYTIRFAYGSAKIDLPEPDMAHLADLARSAPLVVLSGRTDGANPSPGEGRIARERAAAVEAYLVKAGVAPSRIRATWQPAGDHAADNTTPEGRALNRRVDIEIYREAPEIGSLVSDSGP